MKSTDTQNSKIFELAQFQFKSDTIVKQLIDLIPLNKEDVVVEIGPGSGRITKTVAPQVKEIIAVEIDKTCEKDLDAICQLHPNVNIIWQNFLQFPLPKSPYKIVSNIPFNQTRKILEKIITNDKLPEIICLILQTEVSEKINRADGEHTTLSAYIKNFYDCEIIKSFQRNDFTPPAHVDTVALLMQIKKEYPNEKKESFFNFIAESFENPGQPLKNRLKKHFTYKQIKRVSSDLKLNLELPPHTLSAKQWLTLFILFQKLNP